MQPDHTKRHPRPPADPDDYLYGTAVYVERGYVGTELVGDHTSGVQSFTVVDTSQLPEAGKVLVGAEDVLVYDYTTTDEDPDATVAPITIHLPSTTSSSYPDRSPVLVWPLVEYKTALVQLDDPNPGDPSGPVEVHVPTKRMPQMKEGPASYQVRIKTVHGRLEVDDIIGQTPELNLAYATPKTLDPASLKSGSTDAAIEFEGVVQLGHMSQLVNEDMEVLLDGGNSGLIPTQITQLQDQLDALKNSSGRVIDGGIA